jgi:hypothetical protein
VNKILLCCGKKGCPELRIEGDKVKIKFDSGNTEEMLLSQAEMFAPSLKKLKQQEEKGCFLENETRS